MKQKKFFILAAAAGLLAACSESDVAEKQTTGLTPIENNVVGFDAYTGRATTRAGQTGIMKNDVLHTTGFGVFGFYTDNNDYEQSRTPDFFYNQKIEFNSGSSSWGYTPVKYWPNEYGNSAISDDNDRVTFFAYAPYVEVTPASGKIVKAQSDDDQWGITGMSRNNATGDPLVKYIASFEADKSVDLLWGVCDDTNWPIVQGGTVQSINEGKTGLPWLNVQRPKDINHKMQFQFKHALAQFSATVDAYVDANTGGNQLADGTKIYIRQISFTGFAIKGALNLNNTEADKALWMDYNGSADLASGEAITIFDQRKDGKEGADGATATNEKMGGLNQNLISDNGNTKRGVTASAQSLFQSTDPVLVIPTGEEMSVEIVYDVETEDANLSTLLSDGKTLGSSIENRISKTVSFGTSNLENGKHYTLALHLGMNSVKFDAAVTDWQEDYNRPEVDLPFNMPSFAAKANPATTSVDIAASGTAQDYIFAITGLTPGETVTAASVSLAGATSGKTVTIYNESSMSTAATTANASGVVYVKVAGIDAYNSTKNTPETGYISVKGNTSNGEVRLAINQLARKLNFVGSTVNKLEDHKLTVKVNTALSDATDWSVAGVGTGTPAAQLTVLKNGVKVEAAALSNTSTTTADIDISSGVAVGDVFTITIKTGDAPAETQTMTVGGIKFSNPVNKVSVGSTVTNVPVIIGSGTLAYLSNKTDNATVSDGVVTGIKAATAGADETVTITATLTGTDNTPNGYFYPTGTNDLKASYDINVTPQIATISLAQPTPVAAVSGTSTVVAESEAKLYGADGAEITANKPTVTYTSSDATNFTFDTTDAYKLKNATGAAAGSYQVTVTANATANEYYKFVTATAQYTVTITITAAP